MATFTNQATLSYNGNTVTSNTVQGELLEVLTATKTAVNTNYNTGDNITYVISITNSGTTSFEGLTLTDDLGAYQLTGGTTVYPLAYEDGTVLYYINGVLQPPPTVTAGPPMTITGISVPAGGNATLVYETIVTQFAPLGTGATINNTATLAGTGVSTPVTAVAPARAATDARLNITKSVTPSVITENGRLTYTFLIENTGNAAVDVDAGAVVTDTFDPILSNLTVTYNGTAFAPTTDYTYNEATGEFATVAGRITVPEATYTQNPDTGVWSTVPGTSTLVVSGTV